MKNAPFQFFPEDWFTFFSNCGWKVRELKYLMEESLRVGRKFPMPCWSRIAMFFMPPGMKKKRIDELNKMMGYGVLEPINPR